MDRSVFLWPNYKKEYLKEERKLGFNKDKRKRYKL